MGELRRQVEVAALRHAALVRGPQRAPRRGLVIVPAVGGVEAPVPVSVGDNDGAGCDERAASMRSPFIVCTVVRCHVFVACAQEKLRPTHPASIAAVTLA